MNAEKVGAYMRNCAVTAGFIACFMLASSPVSAAAQWNVGISGGNDGIDGFHVSIGEYYRVPAREVVVVRDRGICDEDLPVVFFIAQRAHVHPDSIVLLRHRGMSWMDITLHFGLSPEIYYVPVPVGYVYPQGHAYGYYRNHPRHDWRKIRFQDRDIVNQVNLRFMTEHHRYSPDRVIKYRSEGRSFTRIHRDIAHERHGRVVYTAPRGGRDQRDHRDNGQVRIENRTQDHGRVNHNKREERRRPDQSRENRRGR